MKQKRGKIYLIGAGPGDPGLLTLRGAQLLSAADAVVYDWLVNPQILSLAPRAEKIYVGKNIKAKAAGKYIEQKKIHPLLLKLARQGKNIVRLKGGDPFVFGRGGEEAEFLAAHQIPFEIVPGVSAGFAVPAYAGIPVTDRRFASQVTFMTGHEDPAKPDSALDWKSLARSRGTLVSFMGVRTLASVCKNLMAEGKSAATPVAVIQWGTLPGQRTVEGTLGTIAKKVVREKIESPALTVIGDVVSLRKKLRWFEARPLSGKKVLVTRARSQASELKSQLENLGAGVLEYPSIEILPPRDPRPLDAALQNISQFDWIIFTSANGADSVFERMKRQRLDARIFYKTKVAAIGEATKSRLESFGICPDLVPKKFTSQALLEAMLTPSPSPLPQGGEGKGEGQNLKGKKILLPRTDIAPKDLKIGLEKYGASVTEVVAYHTVTVRDPEKQKELLNSACAGGIDYVTFTSSSTVKNFFEALPKAKRKKFKSRFISIGPVTSQTLREFGFKPFREAKEHTISGLIEALVNGKK